MMMQSDRKKVDLPLLDIACDELIDEDIWTTCDVPNTGHCLIRPFGAELLYVLDAQFRPTSDARSSAKAKFSDHGAHQASHRLSDSYQILGQGRSSDLFMAIVGLRFSSFPQRVELSVHEVGFASGVGAMLEYRRRSLSFKCPLLRFVRPQESVNTREQAHGPVLSSRDEIADSLLPVQSWYRVRVEGVKLGCQSPSRGSRLRHRPGLLGYPTLLHTVVRISPWVRGGALKRWGKGGVASHRVGCPVHELCGVGHDDDGRVTSTCNAKVLALGLHSIGTKPPERKGVIHDLGYLP
ncbi:hypothetical protein JB92DRAFT_3098227 [Gautieria morchelliformis]|nr:hypothetical protein JB92DRAFT_3098227 [Gautieria morchelliformis]